MKRYKESSKMFKKAIEMNPGYTEAYFNYGLCAKAIINKKSNFIWIF